MGNYSCNCDSDFEVVNRGGVITCGCKFYRCSCVHVEPIYVQVSVLQSHVIYVFDESAMPTTC